MTTAEALAQAGGVLRAEPFLHCCTEAQLPFVLTRWFAGRTGLTILRFDPATVDGTIVWERSEAGMDPFPHVYGGVPLATAVASELPGPAG